jgi:hypothetical protein
MSDFVVVMRPIASLSPYIRNARVHSPEQIALIAKSIELYGWTQPLVIDEGDRILAGHGRLAAALLRKETIVPCRVIEGLSDAEKRAYVLVDNEVHDQSEWDPGLMSSELDELAPLVPLLGELFGIEDEAPADELVIKSEPDLPETGPVRDEFWITLSGPLEKQAFALQLIRQSLDMWPGLEMAQGVLQRG